jgi:hypothetical protein
MTKPQLVAAALAVVAVLVFDTIAAFVSKGSGFGYRWFGILEILLYLAIGFFGARATGTWRGGLGVVVIAAIAEATLGWYISALVGPGALPANTALPIVASAALFAILWNGTFGLLGALVGARIGTSRLPPLGAFALFALVTTASAVAAPAISIVPSGPAANVPLTGRMLVFMQPVKDPKAPVPANLDPGFVADGFELIGFDVRRSAGATIVVPANAQTFPKPLSALPAGLYDVQPLLDTRRMYTYDDIGAGDLLGPVQRVTVGPNAKLRLTLEHVATARPAVPTATVRLFSVRSPLLSTFYHTPTVLRASVVLPDGYDSSKRYPVIYWMNGFGGTYTTGYRFDQLRGMMAGDGLHAILVVTDSSGPTGITQFADSATNGPWGAAFVHDFVPAIERAYPIDGTVKHRFLWGHSSGAWAALWLQVAYPTFFGGSWSSSPDPVDFHDFTGPDLLKATPDNAYVDPYGHPWQLVRLGKLTMTLRDFVLSSDVMGYRSSQFGSFDAVFSPPGPNGAPLPLFDHRTGRVDPHVVAYWEARYDIASKIAREWPVYGTSLTDRIHVAVGTLDTFHLERGVLRLDARIRQLGITPDITYFPNASHFSLFQKSTDFEGYHWAFRGMTAALAATSAP